VTETQSATFSITATGTAPLLYQWRKNGVNISGATSVSYVTAATTMADNGARFSCIVSNSAGSITSNEALLTVNPIAAPVIVTQPADQNAGVGRTATFTVTASGIGTLSYQWYRGGNAISGATLAAYTTPILTLEDNGARFSCRVTNTGGSVTSNEALLTVSVEAAPQITTQPLSVRVNAGQAVSLTVAATGSAPLSYQWKRGSVNVGSNSATLTFQTVNLADAGMYYVIVSNAFGTITSAKAMLTVLSAGSRFNSQKMSISGELRDANGNPVGNTTPVNVEMTLRVMNSDVGGAALVVETFRNSTNQGVSVDKGLFTVRLGEGTTEDNLQAVMAENPNLWVEIILEGTTPDTLRPRTPLTANGQSLVSNGTQPMHGNGAPGTQTVAVTGTLYIDDASGVTWIKINTGWRRLE
jgi:hypothetical protein